MDENEPDELDIELDVIRKVLDNLPDQLTSELVCNIFANIIVSYGLFDQVVEINAGTIMCACKIYEEQQSVLH